MRYLCSQLEKNFQNLTHPRVAKKILPGHAYIFGPLFLRIEFRFSSGLSQHSQLRLFSLIVRKLEVKEGILERITGGDFRLRRHFDPIPPNISGDHNFLVVNMLQHFRNGLIGMRNNKFVKVDEHQVSEIVHVAVQTVVKGGKEPLGSNLGL